MSENQYQFLPNVPLTKLRFWDKNYRSISPRALSHLKNKIKEIGIFKPLLAIAGDEPDTYQIIGGNQRLLAYKELGIESTDILFFPALTDKKLIAKIAIADNQSDGFTDPEKLLALCNDAELTLEDLKDFELPDEKLSINDIFPEQELSSEYDDATPAVQEGPAFTQAGDVYLLGRHRLICGDSTSAETMAQLMGDETADLLLTDPPYNVDYEGKAGKIANDSMSPEQFAKFLLSAFKNASSKIKAGAGFYIWLADKEVISFRQACQACALQVKQTLIWVKNHFVLGRQDYQWRHEPCLYGWKDGQSHYFTDDRTLTTILEFPRPVKSEEHPTMKPVALFSHLIRNSTHKDEIVLDPFGGSGTSLIACELLDRQCRTIELSPHYCDVIVKRFAGLETGLEIVLLRGGVQVSCKELLEAQNG